MGATRIAPLSDEERDLSQASVTYAGSPDHHMIVAFQNEYLYAGLCEADDLDASQQPVCTVPDLISILGQDGEGIGSQELRYGLRVNVLAMPAHPLWKSAQGLKVGGPEGFGLEMPVVAVDNNFTESRSVIDEFDN